MEGRLEFLQEIGRLAIILGLQRINAQCTDAVDETN
jgi:hypothetical protein